MLVLLIVDRVPVAESDRLVADVWDAPTLLFRVLVTVSSTMKHSNCNEAKDALGKVFPDKFPWPSHKHMSHQYPTGRKQQGNTIREHR